MKWNRFRLKTKTEAEDIVSSMLADLGVEGVEIEDKVPLTEADKEQMFVDILPETEEDDGVAYLSFYLKDDADIEGILANVKRDERVYGSGRVYNRRIPDRRRGLDQQLEEIFPPVLCG